MYSLPIYLYFNIYFKIHAPPPPPHRILKTLISPNLQFLIGLKIMNPLYYKNIITTKHFKLSENLEGSFREKVFIIYSSIFPS